jgi:hypothetical protein
VPGFVDLNQTQIDHFPVLHPIVTIPTTTMSSSRTLFTFVGVAISSLASFQMGLLTGNFHNHLYDETKAFLPLHDHDNVNDKSVALRESFGFFKDISDTEWIRLKQKVKDVYPNVLGGDIEAVRKEKIKAHVFFQNHYEPDFNCRHERRIGKLGDGGKWVCDPYRLDDPQPCLVYSVGSNGDVSFEDAVKKEIGSHCEIHVFDMKDYSEAVHSVGAIFHQWGISDKNSTDKGGRKWKSLKETVQELGHVGRTVDIFKIDCEGCEWLTFPTFFDAGVELRQIQIELHSKSQNSKSNFMPLPESFDFFEAMYRNGYVIFHKEVNIRWWHFGQCIEYAFLKLHTDFFAEILMLPEVNSS